MVRTDILIIVLDCYQIKEMNNYSMYLFDKQDCLLGTRKMKKKKEKLWYLEQWYELNSLSLVDL